ncbi:MAG: GNAT family N-acetyltransferase [Chthoniobacter sp.]|uniref:GNAT family N-acetyltransferase n=1 Tax=Chthoniobacter sp. TaxID=2510640 RepID=UPI0032A7D326
MSTLKESPTYDQAADAFCRPAMFDDLPNLANIHRLAFFAAMPEMPVLHTPEEDLNFYVTSVFASAEIRVVELSDTVVGFIAFRPGWIDHFYVHPSRQRRGLGARLLAQAQAASDTLHAWTFQCNDGARHFYEKHGFRIERQTDGSANEEKQPDILYVWQRGDASVAAPPEPDPVVVRRIQSADAPAAAKLLTALGYPSDATQVERRLAAGAKGADTAVFVAEIAGRIAGLLSFHCIPLFHEDGCLGRITSLVVADQFRQRGVGRQLVLAGEEFGRANRCVRIEVTSGDHRPEAHAFYEHLGYQNDCRRFIKHTPGA